ncbi:MAG: ATP-dependent protease ATPase subunit HslU, partial [Candidatus Eisenbacteria bacterium]|nr:ATP-dependent protease ATPase subunit HslU [Candidatus Eisenbacteria bacterium]
ALLPRPARPPGGAQPADVPSLFEARRTEPAAAAVSAPERDAEAEERWRRTREKLRRQLAEGVLEDREIEIDVTVRGGMPSIEIFSNTGLEEMELNLPEALQGLLPNKKKRRRVRVAEARRILVQEATTRLIDEEKLLASARERVQNNGIVFIDEIDKICTGEGPRASHGPDVSREGVQRDLLPIVEGASVATRYGLIKTDHILFIAAGAFHSSKPSDLIPELQGRFPIRVELSPLTEGDFVRILTEPKNALLKQYTALLSTEGVRLRFTRDGIARIAQIATQVNETTENIGARRLHTVLTTLLEDLLFEVPESDPGEVAVDGERVDDRLSQVLEDKDLSRYIL